MHTTKHEEVDLSKYRDFAGAQIQESSFIGDVYNRKRIHCLWAALRRGSPRQRGLDFQEMKMEPVIRIRR